MKKSLLITAAILMGTAGYASADNAKPTTFAEMDVNSDMVLTKEEVQGRLLQNFDKLDIDGNGTLSQNEMPMGKQGKAGRDHKGPNFADLDKNGDNVLSQDEVQGRMLDHFAQLDKDGNGTLSQDEMPMGKQGKGGRDHKGPNFTDLDKNGDNVLSQEEVQGRMLDNFAQLDKDGNGTLSQDEMPIGKNGKQGKSQRHHERPTFAQLDTNKDGNLSEAEYNAKPQGNKDKGHERQNFQQMDKNHDGALDKTEVRGRLLANFEQLDVDNSGSLSSTELPSQQK